MLDLEDRLHNLESTMQKLKQDINKLPSLPEKNEVADDIFAEIRGLRTRVSVLVRSVALIKSRLEDYRS